MSAFDTLSHPERIKLFAWFLHTQERLERVDVDSIRKCYDRLHLKPPNLSRDLARLAERTPPELLHDATGYRLEARGRSDFDAKYGDAPTTIAVTKLLAELPSKIPSLDESNFLREALACYKVQAFRATIVMAWNLAFDHLLRWLLADATRLQKFNARIPARYPKKKDVLVNVFEDFEDPTPGPLAAFLTPRIGCGCAGLADGCGLSFTPAVGLSVDVVDAVRFANGLATPRALIAPR